MIKHTNNIREVIIMKDDKNKDNVIRKHNPTLSDINKAAERQEFIDPEKGPENKGKKH
jgi:hypothetical protein